MKPLLQIAAFLVSAACAVADDAAPPEACAPLPGQAAPASEAAGGADSSVHGDDHERRLSFTGDILPLLSKAGCNSSGCHSKPKGRNGYTLSVFSFDPESDYYETVIELRGRRVSPAAPEQSLLLMKPTLGYPHEGGQRFSADSEEYDTIVRWIDQGMPYQLPDEPELVAIEIEPSDLDASPGQEGGFSAIARFSNGGSREVTRLADFQSSDPSFISLDEDGRFQVAATVPGEAAVVARYMGQIAVARITLPPAAPLPEAALAGFGPKNFIDEFAAARWRELALQPSEPCSDSEFLRRAALDITGTLPTVERARAFLEDRDPDKRTRLVDELLDHPAWADHWAIKWVDLLRPNPDRVGVKSVYVLDQWIRDAFRNNRPYDEFARAIVTASGSTHRNGPAVILRDRRDPPEITTMISQIFMGVRLDCAQCHHHPNERWSQDDFFQLAAFFGELKRKGTGISPPISGSAEFFFHGAGGRVTHPVTEQVMLPRAPAGPAAEIAEGSDPRGALAEWLTSPDNPFFAKAVVNRVWAEFMGTGFVNPVDDFRVSNPASNPALLAALARDFADHGFDLKHLMRRIANSAVYQRAALPNATNRTDTANFSRSYRRRLPAEVLTDAVAAVTGVPDSFDGMPAGARAIETWNFKISSDMLDAFGRPDASEDCPCERVRDASIVQALHLMNSNLLHEKLTSDRGRVAHLVDSGLGEGEIVEELYLAAYSRFPTPNEMSIALAEYSREGATRRSATEDILWALINSAEFVFNH